MTDRKEINPFELFKMETSDNNEVTVIDDTTTDDKIPFVENPDELDKNKEKEDIDKEDKEEGEEDKKEDSLENEDNQEIKDKVEENDDDSDLFTTFASSLIESDILIALDNKEYESSEEGIKEMFTDTLTLKIDEYKKSKPKVVQDLIEFTDNGGNPEDFINLITKTSYKEIDLEDEGNQKLLIREHLESQKIEESEIDDLIAEYEENKTLAKHSKIAHKILLKNEEDEYQATLKQQEEQRIIKEKQIKDNDEAFKKRILELKELAGIKLTEKDNKAFYDYLTKPVKKDREGNLYTQYQVDSENTDKRLEQAFYQFKGGVKAIEKSVEKKKTMSLKEKLSHYQDKMTGKINTDSGDSSSGQQEKKTKIKLPSFYDKL